MSKKYTTTEAAKRLKLSPSRVRQLILNKTLKSEKIGAFNVVDESEITRFEKLDRPGGRPKQKPDAE